MRGIEGSEFSIAISVEVASSDIMSFGFLTFHMQGIYNNMYNYNLHILIFEYANSYVSEQICSDGCDLGVWLGKNLGP